MQQQPIYPQQPMQQPMYPQQPMQNPMQQTSLYPPIPQPMPTQPPPSKPAPSMEGFEFADDVETGGVNDAQFAQFLDSISAKK